MLPRLDTEEKFQSCWGGAGGFRADLETEVEGRADLGRMT